MFMTPLKRLSLQGRPVIDINAASQGLDDAEQAEEIQGGGACNLPDLVLEFVNTFLKGERND